MSSPHFKDCCQQAQCAPNCQAWRLCDGIGCESNPKQAIAGYATIGKPDGPLQFQGPYWTAWHNSITSRDASVEISIKINAWQRTIVQSGCGGSPSCDALATPGRAANCTFTALPNDAGCKVDQYMDNMIWNLSGRLAFQGGSKDQDPCVDLSPTLAQGYPVGSPLDPQPYCSIPPGPFPNSIVDTTRSGVNPDRPTAVGTGEWFPGENRNIAPRFYGESLTLTRTPMNNLTYPNTNPTCGVPLVTNRCNSTTSSTTVARCMDLPITVIPGHKTTFTTGQIDNCAKYDIPSECGLPNSTEWIAHVDNPENGGENACWAIDVEDQDLYDTFSAWGISTTQEFGSTSGVWIVLTTAGKVRFLFGSVDSGYPWDPASGAVFGFPDGAVVATGVIDQNIQRAGQSTRMTVDIEFTPTNWCLQNPRCPCGVSYSEQGLGKVTTSFSGNSGGVIGTTAGSGCNTTVNYGSYVLGLESYDIPYCELVPPGSTPSCRNTPIQAGFTWTSPYPNRSDYVGTTPVERNHAGWKRYRNKFNHWYLENPRYSGMSALNCCGTSKPISNGAGWTSLWNNACTRINAAWKATHGPCAGANGDCVNHLDSPSQTAAGCHDVQFVSGSPNFALGYLETGPTCMGCDTISNSYSCGPCFFLANCSTVLYDDCDCCGQQLSVTPPEVMIVGWNGQTCTPLGTHTLYASTIATMCEGLSAWTAIGTATVS